MPAERDLALLRELLRARSEILDRAVERVRAGLGISPTSRIKNTGTILEKLRRSGGSGLKSIQDLGGMRIVGDFDRRGQDDLVGQLVELFSTDGRSPKVVDRRVRPMHGYSAVHVIVFPEGAPVEIQVRTPWQHEWAELFEKLADLIGRGIRYGEPPENVPGTGTPLDESWEAIIATALSLAEIIAAVETNSVGASAAELDGIRSQVTEALAQFQRILGTFG